MITKQTVLDALRHLEEPGSNLKLAELNRIRDVVVKGNEVRMTIVISKTADSVSDRLREEAASALRQAGIDRVHIRFRPPLETDIHDTQGKTDQKVPQAGIVCKEGEIITIASGKGGVGKSTVTANLAVALAAKGMKVGVIDADIYGFSIPSIMGIKERPLLEENMVVPIEAFGVKVVSMGFFSEDNAPVVWRGPQLGKMLRTFFSLVKWGNLDYLLVDLPPGTGDIPLDLHAIIPQSKEIIVTTPHANAAHVAARAGGLARKMEHEILGVIENMSFMEINGARNYVFGTGGGENLAREFNTKLLTGIPLEYSGEGEMESLYVKGTYLFQETSRAGKAFAEVAEKIMVSLKPRYGFSYQSINAV